MSANQTEKLRLAALAADERFGQELARAYGARASDARYKRQHKDPGVTAAMQAKLEADRAYWARLKERS